MQTLFMQNHTDFEQATPEQAGVTSASIINMINVAERKKLGMHSFLLLRHGRVAAQLWWKPYAPEHPQHIYSFGKSVTATAVGLAVGEGLLGLDDRVTSFFPRRAGNNLDARMYTVTVRHLLSMTSGVVIANEATMQLHVDWVSWFLSTPLMSAPGEKFVYNSMNTYMLSAILRKVTGVGLVDYLMPRLFEPLGIERPEWEKCPMGIECGGWGLSLKTEDMAKLCQLYLDDGVWKGKRLLPENWVKQAGCLCAETVGDDKFDHPQNNAGYGFGFWMNRDGCSYRADGMMGQYGLIIPDKDAVIITTAGTPDQMQILDLVWDNIVMQMDSIPEGSQAGEEYDELCALSEHLELSRPEPQKRSRETEQKYSGKQFAFSMNLCSMVPMAIRYLYELPMLGIDKMGFDFGEEISSLTWHEDGVDHSISFTLDGEYTADSVSVGGRTSPVMSCGAWTSPDTLEVYIRYIHTAHMLKANFRFAGEILTYSFDEDPPINDSLKMVIGLTSLTRPVSGQFAKVISKRLQPINGKLINDENKPDKSNTI